MAEIEGLPNKIFDCDVGIRFFNIKFMKFVQVTSNSVSFSITSNSNVAWKEYLPIPE